MLSSQERQLFITYVSVYVFTGLHQSSKHLKHTKVFCDNQDLFNVCLKKSLWFIKFYMSSWSVISAIIYHQRRAVVVVFFFISFQLDEKFEDEKQDI